MFAALAALLAAGSASLDASSVIPLDLRQCVDYSGLAFAGTVSSVKAEYTRTHSTIVTRVTFSRITVAKGQHAGPTVVMTFDSGTRVGEAQFLEAIRSMSAR